MNKLRLLLFIAPLWCFSQNVVFGDPNLKALLTSTDSVNYIAYSETDGYITSIDTNGDGEIQVSEAQAVWKLGILYANVSSLDGLEAFSNLRALDVFGLSLTDQEVDFSVYPELKYLNAGYCQLTSAQINNLQHLEYAYMPGNGLTSIALTNLPALQQIDLSNNGLQTLTLENLPQLTLLGVAGNQLSTLVLSGMPLMSQLNVSSNQLTSLDLSGMPALTVLSADGNQL
ncbi:MAG TPA: hypothetical protein VK183_00540, partial [Flavobacterium sp.]|nr:hypothetical protein [Flavobacterium sp.]